MTTVPADPPAPPTGPQDPGSCQTPPSCTRDSFEIDCEIADGIEIHVELPDLPDIPDLPDLSDLEVLGRLEFTSAPEAHAAAAHGSAAPAAAHEKLAAAESWWQPFENLDAAGAWDDARPWILAAGAVLLLGWILTFESRLRQARRLVFSKAAFLVPPALGLGLLTLIYYNPPGHEWLWSRSFHENPFGMEFAKGLGRGGPGNVLAVLAVAVTLGGHIGLLEAWRDGRKLDGFACWRGIRRYAPTLLLAKLLLAGAVYALSTWVRPSGMPLMLYLLPSVLLAPLPGILTRDGGSPRSIRRAIEHGYSSLGQVTWRVILLLIFCVGLLQIHGRVTGTTLDTDLLTYSTSTLSWNAFPYAQLGAPPAWVIFCIVASAAVATISVTAHWLAINVEEPVVETEDADDDAFEHAVG